ncbi:hypothetical protein BDY19DRAFT_169027 [Irpex rosettiformis]|uniref:Uncharacterized protein n=1 Tax=Irpex rosettiformis TaxID=378272 RepID=A0ACB8U2C7_9APHY|nr:hypothetical protein BDY19DRAFT_169027 [Irpex rosettiformis]
MVVKGYKFEVEIAQLFKYFPDHSALVMVEANSRCELTLRGIYDLDRTSPPTKRYRSAGTSGNIAYKLPEDRPRGRLAGLRSSASSLDIANLFLDHENSFATSRAVSCATYLSGVETVASRSSSKLSTANNIWSTYFAHRSDRPLTTNSLTSRLKSARTVLVLALYRSGPRKQISCSHPRSLLLESDICYPQVTFYRLLTTAPATTDSQQILKHLTNSDVRYMRRSL